MRAELYTCFKCDKEQWWTEEDIYDGSYPDYTKCDYCEAWYCPDCYSDHKC